MSTATQIAGVPLGSYIFNAAGPKDVTLDELRVIGKSASSAILIKSCTIEPRQGNEEPRYVEVPHGSINSMGLPNLGYQEYLKIVKTLKKEFKQPVIASLAGMAPADIPVLVDAFMASDVDLIELNLSCPNLKGKPQIAYDFEMTDTILKDVCKNLKKPQWKPPKAKNLPHPPKAKPRNTSWTKAEMMLPICSWREETSC